MVWGCTHWGPSSKGVWPFWAVANISFSTWGPWRWVSGIVCCWCQNLSFCVSVDVLSRSVVSNSFITPWTPSQASAIHELWTSDVQASFRKGRGTRDQIANIHWIVEKAREFRKNISFCFIDYAKAFDCVDHNKLWKILKEMGIPDHLTSLMRNLYARQEATDRTGDGTTDWFQIGKGVRQGWILSPHLFNSYAEYIMRNAGLEEAQDGITIAGRNINTEDTTLWQKVKKN